MILNQRGQAFDVFKLLIAAVVAGSILLILLQVIGGIPGIGQKDPNTEASNLVKNGVNSPASPQFSKGITFTESVSLTSKTIASKSEGLSDSQICVLVSEKIPNIDNFTHTGKIVTYNGRTNQKTKLLAICDRGSELEDTLSDLGLASQSGYDFDVTTCDEDFEDGTNTACIVVVVPDSS